MARDDRDDRDRDRERDERRLRRSRRRDDDRSEYRASRKEVSVLGIVALIKGIGALILSMIPCFGMFAIVAAGLALALAILSILIARNSRQGMGFPVAATAVSGSAVIFSVMWIALFGAMFRGSEERAERRAPQPPPPAAQPAPRVQPPQKALPPKNEEAEKAADEKFQKQLLEDLAKDRIKETIRNGPGLPVTAEKLEEEYRTNVVAGETKYKDKVLAVTGTVVQIITTPDKKNSTVTLEFEAGEHAPVKCEFTAQTKHPLASVKVGQEVTVRGLCTGRVDDSVQLKDCVLAK